jgi:hypothetical protein
MNKTKFNLEKALKGEKVVTRAGDEVVHLMHIQVKGYYDAPLLVFVKRKNNQVDRGWYTINGHFHSSASESVFDLFMLEESKGKFANVYEGTEGNIYVDNDLYDTYYRAKKSIKNKKQYIKTISL